MFSLTRRNHKPCLTYLLLVYYTIDRFYGTVLKFYNQKTLLLACLLFMSIIFRNFAHALRRQTYQRSQYYRCCGIHEGC